MEINVLVDEGLEGCLDIGWLRSMAEQVLIAEHTDPNTEMGLVIASQGKIKQLNKTYLGEDGPTDVLAFSLLEQEDVTSRNQPFVTAPDGTVHLGEVIISYPQAVKQAGERHHSPETEIATLLIHGVLHLLGYDHNTLKPKRLMSTREAEILDLVKGGLD